MIEAGDGFRWNCSARTDSVDEELLELMGKAGCQGIFLGIETGSQRMQRIINKDLDIQRAKEVVNLADQLGIETTVSLIAGFPEETWADVRETLDMYTVSLAHAFSSPQLNILAPLSDTPIQTKYRHQLALEELCSDSSHQGRMQNSADRELIRKYPDIFHNFYLVPTPSLDRDCLFEVHEFFTNVALQTRWLIVALHRRSGSIFEIFSAWRRYRMRIRPELRGWSLRRYYQCEGASREFVRFVRSHRLETCDIAVDCFLTYHEAIAQAKDDQPDEPDLPAVVEFQPDDIPVRRSHVHVFELDFDLQVAKRSLSSDEPLKLTDRRIRFFRTHKEGSDLQVLETRPLIAAGLKACNGNNTVSDVRREFEAYFDGSPQTRQLAVDCLLETFRDQNLIRIYSPGNTADAPAAHTSIACELIGNSHLAQ
jgi:hypothetical protein